MPPGLVGQLRSSANDHPAAEVFSVELYDSLESRKPSQATGWKQNGGLRLA